MHYTGYGARSQQTPQSEPMPGSNQQLNNTGIGYSFVVDDMTRFNRFCILGASGGTYYVGERKLVKDNLQALENLLKAGRGLEVVAKIVEISDAGRGVSNDPALFALARCCAADDKSVSRAAYDTLPKVARTGTHLLHFMEYVKQFRGRGRQHRRALKAWYNEKRSESVAYQAVKYQSRDGWSQRDVLRLARPKPVDSDHNAIYHWMVKGWDVTPESVPAEEAMRLIWVFERAKHTSDDNEVADLILKYGLPREAVPTTSLKSVKVWEALLEAMPMEAMVRNLATMTKDGVLVPMGAMTAKVIAMLRDAEAISRARLHPIKILAALTTYASGKSVRGQSTWTPIQQIVDALNDAFYLSFGCVEATGKRILIAIDVSGSMHGTQINGIPGMNCHTAAAAMSLVIANSEQNYHLMAYDTVPHPLAISPKQRLDDVTRIVQNAGGGGTNCAIPVMWALQNRVVVDAFLSFTDSESWQGDMHVQQAVDLYRKQMNIPARVVNVQMAATHVRNSDPNDALSLEVVGFDTSVPSILSSFLVGEF